MIELEIQENISLPMLAPKYHAKCALWPQENISEVEWDNVVHQL